MQQLEEGVSNPTTIEELNDAIKKYEKRVEDIMVAQNRIGVWYKMLMTRYIENQMYGEAFKAAEEAIKYYPTNQNLYYWAALSAGYLAKSVTGYNEGRILSQKYDYLKTAEASYLRALEIEPRYAQALYGIGVLYVFELDQPDDAIPYLERFLDIDKRHTDGMFVLARAYYMIYEFDKAVAMYDRIIEIATLPEKKADAAALKKIVLDASYGG
jgi:tetratricopeptide (TPR) repeat protein